MEDIINNKKVVIVGPAPYLKERNIGNLINEYDTVVRVNRGHSLVNDPDNYGNRTDILYHCMSQNIEDGGPITESLLADIKYLVGAIPKLKEEDNSSLKKGTIHQYESIGNIDKLNIVDKKWYLDIEREINTRPNTGVTMIFDILENYKPSNLYITGFTLFKDGYSKDYRPSIDGKILERDNGKKFVFDRMMRSGNHNQYRIWLKMKEILEYDFVKIDDELRQILEFDMVEYCIQNKLFDLDEESVFYHFLMN